VLADESPTDLFATKQTQNVGNNARPPDSG